MAECAGCAEGLPLSSETDLYHVRYTWDDSQPVLEKRGRFPVNDWKYKDLIPCERKP